MESSRSVHEEDSVASQLASYGVEEVGPQAKKSKNKNKNKNALTLKEQMDHQEMVVSNLRGDTMSHFDEMIMICNTSGSHRIRNGIGLFRDTPEGRFKSDVFKP
ncbi:hypothetical protein ACLOJK_000017 [Asimina triloba]